jgi:crotonobetainyl-CoA:carnitine CoA-transferase CaiB-like acyl-CoA transferase
LGGDREGAPPLPTVPTADLCGAMNAVTAIVGALFRRERQGGGAWLDVSMTDSVAALGAPFVAAWTGMGDDAWKRGGALLGGGLANYAIYETRDGQHLAVGALEPKFFARFAAVCGHPEWAQTPPLPGPWQEPIREQVAATVASRTRDEWEAALEGIDCCVTPVLDPGEAMARPLFRERLCRSEPAGEASWVEHPLGPPTDGQPPKHGEHTDEVLRDELGLSDAELTALRDGGVL